MGVGINLIKTIITGFVTFMLTFDLPMQYDLQIQDVKYQLHATINPPHEPHLGTFKESTSCVGNFR
jgi:hypothetical protein